MIDYLEEVLEETDREDTVPAGGRKTAIRPARKTSPEEPGGTVLRRKGIPAGEEEKDAPADRAEEAGPGAEQNEKTPEAEGLVPDRADLWADRLPRTGKGQEAAGLLLGAMAAAGRSVRALERSAPGIMTVTLPDAGPQSPGPDLEALDLAMQRDARRYDGGFELY